MGLLPLLLQYHLVLSRPLHTDVRVGDGFAAYEGDELQLIRPPRSLRHDPPSGPGGLRHVLIPPTTN